MNETNKLIFLFVLPTGKGGIRVSMGTKVACFTIDDSDSVRGKREKISYDKTIEILSSYPGNAIQAFMKMEGEDKFTQVTLATAMSTMDTHRRKRKISYKYLSGVLKGVELTLTKAGAKDTKKFLDDAFEKGIGIREVIDNNAQARKKEKVESADELKYQAPKVDDKVTEMLTSMAIIDSLPASSEEARRAREETQDSLPPAWKKKFLEIKAKRDAEKKIQDEREKNLEKEKE